MRASKTWLSSMINLSGVNLDEKTNLWKFRNLFPSLTNPSIQYALNGCKDDRIVLM